MTVDVMSLERGVAHKARRRCSWQLAVQPHGLSGTLCK